MTPEAPYLQPICHHHLPFLALLAVKAPVFGNGMPFEKIGVQSFKNKKVIDYDTRSI